jgi:hypothetical protein
MQACPLVDAEEFIFFAMVLAFFWQAFSQKKPWFAPSDFTVCVACP